MVALDVFYSNWNDAIEIVGDLLTEGYEDWYLPNIEELVLIQSSVSYGNYNIGGFPTTNYWSSTEYISGD